MGDHYYSKQPSTASDPKHIDVKFKDENFRFKTDSGVFSIGKVDFGSSLLINNFIAPKLNGPLLDVGCGYGPIGLTLAKFYPDKTVHMVDVNERALSLAKENAQINNINNIKIYPSDCLSNVSSVQFSAIITNPPIRAGKKVVYKIFSQAKEYLREDGQLWIVIQKKQGAPSAIKYLETLFKKVEVVKRQKGYFIIKATKTIDK